MHLLFPCAGNREDYVKSGSDEAGGASSALFLPAMATRGAEALPLLALYLSAVIHDYDHRGLTNAFLIQDEDELAVSETRSSLFHHSMY